MIKKQKGNNQCSIAFAVRLLIQKILTSSGGWGDVEELNAPTSKKIEHWEQQ